MSGRGINIHNVKLENNKSLLMCAVSKKMCTLLFQVYGANIEHENDNGVTAVMVFASRGYFECAQYILDHGANVNHMSTSRKNALWNAVNRGYPNMIDLIINKGGDVNYPYPTYKNKWEPLLYIAAKNKTNISYFNCFTDFYINKIIFIFIFKQLHSLFSGTMTWANSMNI